MDDIGIWQIMDLHPSRLPKNLELLIAKRGFKNATVFASGCSIPRTTIHRIMTEAATPTIDVLARLGEALSVPWWSLYAVDFTKVDPDLVDWDEIFENQTKVVRERDSLRREVAKTTTDTIKSILAFKAATGTGDRITDGDISSIADAVATRILAESIFVDESSLESKESSGSLSEAKRLGEA